MWVRNVLRVAKREQSSPFNYGQNYIIFDLFSFIWLQGWGNSVSKTTRVNYTTNTRCVHRWTTTRYVNVNRATTLSPCPDLPTPGAVFAPKVRAQCSYYYYWDIQNCRRVVDYILTPVTIQYYPSVYQLGLYMHHYYTIASYSGVYVWYSADDSDGKAGGSSLLGVVVGLLVFSALICFGLRLSTASRPRHFPTTNLYPNKLLCSRQTSRSLPIDF